MTNIHACLVHEQPECVSDLIANLRFLDPESLVLLYDGSPGRQLLQAGIGTGVENVIVHPDPRPMRWGRLHDFAFDCLRLALTIPEFSTLTVVDSDQLALRAGYSSFLRTRLADGVGCLVSPEGGYQAESSRSPVARAARADRPVWSALLDEIGGEDRFPQWTFWPGTVITRAAGQDIVRLVERPSVVDLLRRTRLWATEEVLIPTLAALAGYRVERNPGSFDYVRYRVRYTQRDLQRAVHHPDAYWIHPVPRLYNDANRRYLRERHNGYRPIPRHPAAEAPGEDPPSPDPTPARAHVTTRPRGDALQLTLPLLDRMAAAPGVLSRSEGDLLIAAARHALTGVRPPAEMVLIGPACERARLGLDAVGQAYGSARSRLSNAAQEPGPGAGSAVIAYLAASHDFTATLLAYAAAEQQLADGTVVAVHAGADQPGPALDCLRELGVLALLGQVGSLSVFRLERRLALARAEVALAQSARVVGWLSRDEAALLALAVGITRELPAAAVVEVGSYCGRATVVLASVAAASGRSVVAIDRFDGVVGAVGALHQGKPTLERFRAALRTAGVEETVEVLQGSTSDIVWTGRPVAMLLVDGLHDYASAEGDFRRFAGDVVEGGLVAFHDCADYFPGVQALVRELECTPTWQRVASIGSLVILRRVPGGAAQPVVGPPAVRVAAVVEPTPASPPRDSAPDPPAPLVSCIMPTYNRPAYVELAIGFFRRQTYTACELVIVDDGDDPVEHLVPVDTNIRYVRSPGRTSIGDKRNLACEVAAGELIAHWDDDDWYAPDRLARQVEALTAARADVVGANRLVYWAPDAARAWRYAYPAGGRPWLHDPTLCFRKALWTEQPFPRANHALDCGWLWSGPRKQIHAMAGDPFYVGLVHPTNTSPKATADPRWTPAPLSDVAAVIGADFDRYPTMARR